MAEHTKQPGGFSGRAAGVVAVTCGRCGTVLDVLYHNAGDATASESYQVRCLDHACTALLDVELPSPPIAVLPHHQ